jgi:hypothetical protein
LKTNEMGSQKKPYQKPNLRVYGDVRTMTATSMNMGTLTDTTTGGIFHTKKTA